MTDTSRLVRVANRRLSQDHKKEQLLMHFLTDSECREWRDQRFHASSCKKAVSEGGQFEFVLVDRPEVGQIRWFAGVVCSMLKYSNRSLLWITETGIWDDREDLYLYYQLKCLFGNRQLINEVPGHLFLGYETNEVMTFTYLALLFGWNALLLADNGETLVEISHDDWISVHAGIGWGIPALKSRLIGANIRVIKEDLAKVSE